MKKLSYLIAVLSLLITSCKKDEDTNTVDDPAVIAISTPPAGTVLLNGTPLNVQGTVSDNNGTASVNVAVRNKANNTILYNQQTFSSGGLSFYRYNYSWTITGITASTAAIIKVTATDQNGAQVVKEIEVTLDN